MRKRYMPDHACSSADSSARGLNRTPHEPDKGNRKNTRASEDRGEDERWRGRGRGGGAEAS